MIAAKSPKILIVDDIADNIFTLRLMLTILGYDDDDVDDAQTGPDALAKLQGNANGYDVVLLDLMLPGISGLDILREKDDFGDHPPAIIMVSANTEVQKAAEAINLGAVDYITKPIERTLLSARLGAVLRERALQAQVQAQVARLDAEIRLAAQYQRRLCQVQVNVQGVAVAGLMIPALQVGGDFYDAFDLSDGTSLLVLADVCDKGAAAALFTARVHDLVRLIARTLTWAGNPNSAADILTSVNQIICQANPDSIFTALMVAHMTPHDGTVRYCNAGLPPLLQISSARQLTVHPLQLENIPAGLVPDANYQQATFVVERGDWLVCRSDGSTDIENPHNERLGEEGFQALLQSKLTQGAEPSIGALKEGLEAYQGDVAQADDIAILMAYRE